VSFYGKQRAARQPDQPLPGWLGDREYPA